MLLDGDDITDACRRRRAPGAASGRAFQLTQLFPNLTVLENVRLAVQARGGRGTRRSNLWRVWLDHRDAGSTRRALLERVELGDRSSSATARQPAARRPAQARGGDADGAGPEVFMFDEPTAGMSVDDVPVILDLIRALKARKRQDHPAGRTQDGRGARAGRPHHRAAQRPAGGRRRAGRGDRLADRAASLPRHGRRRSRHERRRPARA